MIRAFAALACVAIYLAAAIFVGLWIKRASLNPRPQPSPGDLAHQVAGDVGNGEEI